MNEETLREKRKNRVFKSGQGTKKKLKNKKTVE